MYAKRCAFVCLISLVAAGSSLSAQAVTPSPVTPSVPQNRSVEPIVMTGADFPDWSAGPEISAQEPTEPASGWTSCERDTDEGHDLVHNCSEQPLISNAQNPDAQQPKAKIPNPLTGADVSKLIGYRWDGHAFVQRPFQVDERFSRYIANYASNCNEAGGGFCVGFGGYAGTDKQLSYVYDRDVYKFVHDSSNPCLADTTPLPEQDPIKGLDDNDELTFLARDTGAKAPGGSPSPAGVTLKEVRVDDPSRPGSAPTYFYIGLSGGTVSRAFDGTNGYVHYAQDADRWKWEETSDNYGNAPRGKVCKSDGTVTSNDVPRRPQDTAWILTTRYAFRYAGRWSLQGVRVTDQNRMTPLSSPSDYSAPLLDQWKARAYTQTKEDSNIVGNENEEGWNRTSVTLGEKEGPIRFIRTTWGSDSGTNTVRTEIFYPDMIHQQTYLRVHPIPPLGGIFAYWDQHSAPNSDKQWYFNSGRGDGVQVDGVNDEIVGNAYYGVGQAGIEAHEDDATFDPIYELGLPKGVAFPMPVPFPDDNPDVCNLQCEHVDVPDPTVDASGTLEWEEFATTRGSMIYRTGLNVERYHASPGDAQGVLSFPYYRDDRDLNDDSGSRTCFKPTGETPCPLEDQGLYGAHGVQVFVTPESDNVGMVGTVPVTEVDAQTRIVVLPPQFSNGNAPTSVGAQYGHANDIPLRTTVAGQSSQAETTLTLDGATEATVGDSVTLSATLESNGAPVPNADVTFDFDGHDHNATTGPDGKATVSGPVTALGPPHTANLDVTYAGNTVLAASQDSKTFNIKGKPSSLAFTPESATTGHIGDTVTFAAKLTDADGGVAGATVDFDFQGAPYHGTTDSDGLATALAYVGGPAGETTVRASFGGDYSHDPSSDATASFAVTKKVSALWFRAKAARGYVVVSVNLQDAATSEGLARRTVAVFVNNAKRASITTDVDGNGMTRFKLKSPRGKIFRVEFAGDDVYAPATVQAKFGSGGAAGFSR